MNPKSASAIRKDQISILFEKIIQKEPSLIQRVNEEMKKDKEYKEETKDEFFNVKRRGKAPTQNIREKKFIVSDWRNSVIILVSVRLGLKNVEKEYFDAFLFFFNHTFNVGIIGGVPKEAYYLVGIQGEFLIFLDPHTTKEAIP